MMFVAKFFPFIVAWAFVNGNIRKDKILFLQRASEEKNEILLVMTWTENEEDMTAGCEIFSDEESINKTLAANDVQIRTLPADEMQILLGDCMEYNHQRKKRDIDNDASAEDFKDDDNFDEDYDDNFDDDYDELSRINRRGSNRRRGSGRRTSNKRNNKERGRKPNETRTTSSTSTTTSLNEIEDVYDKVNRQRPSGNRSSAKNELERESEESFDSNITTAEPPTTLGYDGLPIIFPGTKWCGAGYIAENYSDLGRYEDTDRCCRAHDLCNDTLAPGETRYKLTNTSPFTKLSCQCDDEFFKCLDEVRSIPANSIGNLYFNMLRSECYALDYPPSRTCKKYLTIFKLTCSEYEKDTSKEKVYQWIKPKRFPRI